MVIINNDDMENLFGADHLHDLGVVVVLHRRIDDICEDVSNDKRYIIIVVVVKIYRFVSGSRVLKDDEKKIICRRYNI